MILSPMSSQDETDEQYLRKVADVMHSLFGTHGSSLLPFFDQLLPTFAGMLVSSAQCPGLPEGVLKMGFEKLKQSSLRAGCHGAM